MERDRFVFRLGTKKIFLRAELLLKSSSGYPRDEEVTLLTLANPEHSLRFNTHLSVPPVSALARSVFFPFLLNLQPLVWSLKRRNFFQGHIA